MAGLATTFGSGAMTNSISEIEFNDVLLIIGSNTTEAHPIIGLKMKKAARRGAKLIVADPRKIELVDYATLWLRLKPGTDAALVNGLIHIIVQNGMANWGFIEERTEGFESMWAVAKNYPPERVSQITGVPIEKLYQAAELYAKTERAGIYYTLGITEHTTGTANVMNLANLAMVTGHVGVQYAGVNPLRGQNNVQGACDMGALPNVFPGYRNVNDPGARAIFEKAWNVRLDERPGLRIPEMMDRAVEGSLKALYIMGEDPALTEPDLNHVRRALENLEFVVVQDLFLTETAKHADVVLPGASYAEKDGTFTNTERRVQRVRMAISPLPGCKADWQIICELSRRMGYEMSYDSPKAIWEEIRNLVPTYRGITYERLEEGGIQWPCPDTAHPGTKFLHEGRFARGKGLFVGVEYEEPAELTNEEYPVLLTTGRMLYHYNTMTRHSRGINDLWPEELAEINPEDARRIGVKSGDRVVVSSRRGEVVTKVKVTPRVPPGVMFMTFHFSESPANVLTNSAFDPVTKTAEYKVCAVRVDRCGGCEHLSG